MAGSTVSPNQIEEQLLWGALAKGAANKDAPEIKKIEGTKISVVGWLIPNEFDHDELVSFLLARYPGGCVHVPLPPPESVIHVTMSAKSKKLKNVSLTKKVQVDGILTHAGRVDATFELAGESIRELDP